MLWGRTLAAAACLLGGGQAIVASGGGQNKEQRQLEAAPTPRGGGTAPREDEYQQSNSHSYPVYHHAEHGYGGEGQGPYGGHLAHGAAIFPGHEGGGLYQGAHAGHGVAVGGYGYSGLELGGPPPVYHHQHHHYSGHKEVALKGLLVPLAGVALLGAAAALVSHPVLLQLGVVSGRRRRRRDAPRLLGELELLETFIAQVPQEQALRQEKQLLASYLACGSATNSSSSSLHCVERLACELNHPLSRASQLDRHVMDIVTRQILSNEYVPATVKQRVESAARAGSLSGDCLTFPCIKLEN